MQSKNILQSLYENKSTWYSLTKDFWKKTEASDKGMLEGNMQVHQIDVDCSCEILTDYINKGVYRAYLMLYFFY